MRVLKTTWTEEWESPDAPRPLAAPYQLLLAGELHQAVTDYRVEPFMIEAAGQGIAFITESRPVADIVRTMVEEARQTLDLVSSGSQASVTT
jgi:NAD(P)H-dependent flavin oxidoreductase YrpB (nitropropane dioxygenase family)